MKINTSSWHYRLLRELSYNVPRSLCPYFWKVVFTLFIILLFAFGVLVCSHGIGHTVLGKIDIALGIVWLDVLLATVFGLVIITLEISLVVGIFIFADFTKNKLDKSESIAVGYAKAVKSKICPTLEFVDKE